MNGVLACLLALIALWALIEGVSALERRVDAMQCPFTPEPKLEDVRLCAPAASPGLCFETLGYQRRCEGK